MKRFRIVLLLVMTGSLFLGALPVQAQVTTTEWNSTPIRTLGCYLFRDEYVDDGPAVAEGLSVEVLIPLETTEYTAQMVKFVFRNAAGNIASSITEVYFDDDALLDPPPEIDGSDGVNFSVDATPANLPGGEELNPDFETRLGLSADSNEPPPKNGVNPGEWLGLAYSLLSDLFATDVLADLDDGSLRIGLHVTSIGANSVSESYICQPGPPTAIELISFVAFAGDGSVGLGWETGTEVDNAGFNLYRALSVDGPWTKLNSALIAAQGDAVKGARYSFVDSPGKGTFYYLLEDADYNGVTTLHGPVEATVAPLLLRPFFRPVVPTR